MHFSRQVSKFDRVRASISRHYAMPLVRLPQVDIQPHLQIILGGSVKCILRGNNMPSIADWRSAAAYTYLNDLTPAELAWEFLRRNPDYQREYRTHDP